MFTNQFSTSEDLRQPTDSILKAVLGAQACYNLFPTPADTASAGSAGQTAAPARQVVVVGVSGGADSVCLLHVLLRLQDNLNLALHVGHVDHGLRPDSPADAEFVKTLADRWHLPFHLKRLKPGELNKPGQNIESAARRARYSYLWTVAQTVTPPDQTPVIAVAHTADDQAETLLMHLLRGSGLAGLGGMRRVSELRATDPRIEAGALAAPIRTARLVRPFLDVSRSLILRYLDTEGLSWREDPTNRDTSLLRNRIRRQFLPALEEFNPGIRETLLHTSQLLAGEADRADRLNRAALGAVLQEPTAVPSLAGPGLERVVLELDAFRALDTADQRGALRLAVQLVMGQEVSEEPHGEQLSFRQIEDVRCKLLHEDRSSGPHTLLGDIRWTVAPPLLSFHKADALPFRPVTPLLDPAQQTVDRPIPIPGRIQIDPNWNLNAQILPISELPSGWRDGANPWQAFFDADRVRQPILTTRKTGQRFAPLGLHGQHKSLADFFTDHKIPPPMRDRWPILVDAETGEILWVCGLRMGHSARITNVTRRVLWLRWERLTPKAGDRS
jgi:tRNA(Ile)-lysidine synthase